MDESVARAFSVGGTSLDVSLRYAEKRSAAHGYTVTGVPEVASNAPENIAAIVANVDYWSKAMHEASLQLRALSEQLSQMRVAA